MHRESAESRRTQQGGKTSEQSLPSCWNFWATLQSFPLQEKWKKKRPSSFMFSNCAKPACKWTCMHVCYHVYPGMHWEGGKHKGREGSWGHFVRLFREVRERMLGRGWRQGGPWRRGCWTVQGRECRDKGGNMQRGKKNQGWVRATSRERKHACDRDARARIRKAGLLIHSILRVFFPPSTPSTLSISLCVSISLSFFFSPPPTPTNSWFL